MLTYYLLISHVHIIIYYIIYYIYMEHFNFSRCVLIQILRQRILEFLVPLTGQYGVQLMASLGAVWSSRKSKRRHKNKVRTAV